MKGWEPITLLMVNTSLGLCTIESVLNVTLCSPGCRPTAPSEPGPSVFGASTHDTVDALRALGGDGSQAAVRSVGEVRLDVEVTLSVSAISSNVVFISTIADCRARAQAAASARRAAPVRLQEAVQSGLSWRRAARRHYGQLAGAEERRAGERRGAEKEKITRGRLSRLFGGRERVLNGART